MQTAMTKQLDVIREGGGALRDVGVGATFTWWLIISSAVPWLSWHLPPPLQETRWSDEPHWNRTAREITAARFRGQQNECQDSKADRTSENLPAPPAVCPFRSLC